MSIGTAQNIARAHGMFAKISAGYDALVFYTGNEDDAGTWLEATRLRVHSEPSIFGRSLYVSGPDVARAVSNSL